MTGFLTITSIGSGATLVRTMDGRRASLLIARSADNVAGRAIPRSPRRSAGDTGNYPVLRRTTADFDEQRLLRPVATGWGRVKRPTLEALVSRATGRRELPPELSTDRLSVRQLLQTAKYGRKITFLVFDGEPVEGYLAGLDETHYYVLEPKTGGFQQWLINRANNPAFRLHSESTYDTEPELDSMEEIIGPFRRWASSQFSSRNGKEGKSVNA